MNPITLTCRLVALVLFLVAAYMGACSYAAFGDSLISTALSIAALCCMSSAGKWWARGRRFSHQPD
jgi:hypothetical protein